MGDQCCACRSLRRPFRNPLLKEESPFRCRLIPWSIPSYHVSFDSLFYGEGGCFLLGKRSGNTESLCYNAIALRCSGAVPLACCCWCNTMFWTVIAFNLWNQSSFFCRFVILNAFLKEWDLQFQVWLVHSHLPLEYMGVLKLLKIKLKEQRMWKI